MKKFSLLMLSSLMIIVSGCSSESDNTIKSASITPKEAKQIAKEAYIFGFPLVVNYKTMYNYVIDKQSPEYKGGFNESGFFSITMYDADGWMFSEKAILNKNNIIFNDDGSFDANFGECGNNAKNNLPITKGWNFIMRVYEPKLTALDAYKLPTPAKVK